MGDEIEKPSGTGELQQNPLREKGKSNDVTLAMQIANRVKLMVLKGFPASEEILPALNEKGMVIKIQGDDEETERLQIELYGKFESLRRHFKDEDKELREAIHADALQQAAKGKERDNQGYTFKGGRPMESPITTLLSQLSSKEDKLEFDDKEDADVELLKEIGERIGVTIDPSAVRVWKFKKVSSSMGNMEVEIYVQEPAPNVPGDVDHALGKVLFMRVTQYNRDGSILRMPEKKLAA